MPTDRYLRQRCWNTTTTIDNIRIKTKDWPFTEDCTGADYALQVMG